MGFIKEKRSLNQMCTLLNRLHTRMYMNYVVCVSVPSYPPFERTLRNLFWFWINKLGIQQEMT